MKDKRARRPWRCTPLAALLFATLAPAQPLDTAQLLDDPLRTTHARGTADITLPTDTSAIACPTHVDLSQTLTLAPALRLAACNSAQARLAWIAVQGKAAALGTARANYLPTLQGGSSRLHSRTTYPAENTATAQTGTTLYADFTWRLFDFGARAANEAAADADLRAALASRDAALQSVLSAAIDAFYAAVTAQATVEARNDTTRVAAATLDSTRRKDARGAVAHSDVLYAQNALSKATLERTRAQGEAQKALSTLAYLIGIAPASAFNLHTASEIKPGDTQEAEALDSLASWMAGAQQHHPAITAARAEWEAARQKVTATQREGLPTVDLTSSYYRNGYPGQGLAQGDTHVTNVGLTLTVPLFDGFARHYRIQGARAQVEQREVEWHDTEQQTLKAVLAAYVDATSAARNLPDARALLESARAADASARRRYDKGAADITELLTIQGTLADAQLEQVRAWSDWRSARLKLWSSAGQLGFETVRTLP